MKNILILTGVLLCFAWSNCSQNETNTITSETSDPTTTKGCGDFMLAQKLDTDKIISIWINQKKATFFTSFQSFEHIEQESFATIVIQQNPNQERLWQQTCNDVVSVDPFTTPTVLWKLTQGKLQYKVSKVLDQYNCSTPYKATVILENAVFQKQGGTETITVPKAEFNQVKVGWCAG